FVKKRVMGGRNVNYDFCSSEFAFVSWLDDSHLLPLVQISNPFYIKLVKDFYSNLKMVSEQNQEFAVTSVVKGQRIFLDARILASILHIPHTGIYVFEHKKWPEVEGFHPNQILSILYPNDPNVHPNMALTTNRLNLSLHYRFLHRAVCTHILPKAGGFDEVTHMEAYTMYHLITGRRIDVPFLIINHINAIHDRENARLGYSNIITKILHFFDIDITGEVNHPLQSANKLGKGTLGRMGFKKYKR
ncbi:hypothetical protein CFOL_v3_20746, partial [Cephalotus follicularis]